METETKASRGLGSPLLVLVIYALLFSTSPGLGLYCQVAAVALLGLDACLKLLAGRVMSRRPSVLEGILLAMGVLSMLTTALRGNTFAAAFSIAFVLTILALMALARAYRPETIILSIQTAFVLMVLTVFAVYNAEILQALARGGAWYYRLQPFGLHPNLTGFIFGGGCVLFFYRAGGVRGWPRIFLATCGVVCIAFILAASARGGLLAAAVTIFAVLAFRAGAAGLQRMTLLLILAIVTLPILLLVFDNAYSYLESILELDSATRGWNSGGTGRFGRWQLGLATVFSNPLTLLSGYGLRSTDGLSLGFSIESSYINILIECGVLLGPAFVFAILRLVFAYFPHGSRASAERGPLDVAPVLLLYCMLQSIFNRYLLGIGNPLSLVVLLLAISLSVQGVRSAAASRATNAPSPDPTARPGRTAKLVAAD